jgi:hypothetical protein
MPSVLNQPTARARIRPWWLSTRLAALPNRLSGGVINRCVNLLVTNAKIVASTAVAGDAVANPLQHGKLLGFVVDNVTRLLPLVSLTLNLGIQIPQTADSEGFYDLSQGREGSIHRSVEPSERAELVTQVERMLQVLRIVHPARYALNNLSIPQRGGNT